MQSVFYISNIVLFFKYFFLKQDIKSLTNIVVSLDEFRTMYTGDASEIINTRDPLCTFFSEIGQSYQKTSVSKDVRKCSNGIR